MTLGNDNGTDGQTDRRTDRVRRNMRPPPREEGRIISVSNYSWNRHSLTQVLMVRGLPSFDTVMHNSAFASLRQKCPNVLMQYFISLDNIALIFSILVLLS